jgi:dynein heavy chain 1
LPNTTPFPSISGGDDTDEDSSSHADLEEVTFWLGLEEALRNIQSELDSPPVALTVSLLKAAKRFVATVALENNTGLDAAIFHVGDVANFLRAYPAPALAAAGDWDKIGSAVDAIFAHLPKVRMSKHYDLDRLARLVEASTLTLRERMEGVLRDTCKKGNNKPTTYSGGGIVLGLEYDQYEKLVRRPTQDIFVTFDTSFATFSEFFLDQGRLRLRAGGENARNETPAQVLKGIKLHHLLLRERLDAIYYFRTQHEKLRSVVAEVLMGEDKNPATALVGGGDGDDYAAWALREVDDAPVSLFASIDVLDLSPRGEALFSNALEGYDRKVDAIEEHLARLLRDKLSSCQVSICCLCLLKLSILLLPYSEFALPILPYFDDLSHIVLFRMPRICSECSHGSTPSWPELASVQP